MCVRARTCLLKTESLAEVKKTRMTDAKVDKFFVRDAEVEKYVIRLIAFFVKGQKLS